MNGMATALCAAISIGVADGAPEWVHLLPTGEVRTVDGRGPYYVRDAVALMSASMAAGKLPIDENHATDLAAPKGEPAPARGWIVEMQQRADGIWGRVEWTPEGARMTAAREYRGISPAIHLRRDGTAVAILRASLTNTPNLAGLTSLHSEGNTDMALRELLVEALGLPGDADDAAIVAAVNDKGDAGVALQSALAPIARAAGVADGADVTAIVAGVQRLKGGADDRVTSLQSEVATLTTQLEGLGRDRATEKATAFVDAAIRDGRVGLKPVRDNYIAMHAANPAQAEKLIAAMPLLTPGETLKGEIPTDTEVALNAQQIASKARVYQTKLAEAGEAITFAAACVAVSEGKAE